MAYINLSLFIFPTYLNGIIFNSILSSITSEIFNHNLIQIFLQLVAGLDRVVFFGGFSVRCFKISVSVGGMVKSPKLISSPPDDRGFLGRVMSLEGDVTPYSYFDHRSDGIGREWLELVNNLDLSICYLIHILWVSL